MLSAVSGCVTVIVLDEVHERSVESDLVVAIVREYLNVSPHVKLVLMSATLNEQYRVSMRWSCCRLLSESDWS